MASAALVLNVNPGLAVRGQRRAGQVPRRRRTSSQAGSTNAAAIRTPKAKRRGAGSGSGASSSMGAGAYGSARAEVACVLLLIRWIRHALGEVAKLCERHGKPLVRVPGGYNPETLAPQILAQAGKRLGA